MLSLWGGLGVQLYRGSLLADPAWCHYCPLLGTAQPARIGPPGDGDPVGSLLLELLPNILVPNAFGSHSLYPPWSPWAGTWSHCLGASHTLAWYWSGLGGCSQWGSPRPTGPSVLTSWGWAHPGLDLGMSVGQLPCGLWAQGAGARQCSWEWWDTNGHGRKDSMEGMGTWRGRGHRRGHDGTWEEERAK